MIKTFYILLLIAAQFNLAGTAFAQEGKFRELDRKTWNKLVDEVKRKRYDPRRYEYQPDQKEIEYSDPNGDYSEYRSESSPYNNGAGDGGVYSTSTDDDKFFDKRNDKSSTGKGDDLGPQYNDPDENGDVTKNKTYSDKTTDYKPQDRDYQRSTYTPPTPSKSSEDSAAGGGSSTWLIIVLIAILAAAVVYMIMVSFKEKKKNIAVPETVFEKIENMTITKSELELALEAALRDKNYREAVRIYFIAVIKEMKDHSWIRWEKKKTNYHYINEITGRAQQPDFITATRAFEIVWYGNRTMAEGDYYQVEPLFKRLLTSIH